MKYVNNVLESLWIMLPNRRKFILLENAITETSFITMVTKQCHCFWECHWRSSLSMEWRTKDRILPQFRWSTHAKDQMIRRFGPLLNCWDIRTKKRKSNLIKTSWALFQSAVGQFIKIILKQTEVWFSISPSYLCTNKT